jgi:glucose-1-phosphate thymidylyltransferase
MLEASNYIATIENQQNLKVACLEEIAYNMGFIDGTGLQRLIQSIKSPDYRAYLQMVLEEPVLPASVS